VDGLGEAVREPVSVGGAVTQQLTRSIGDLSEAILSLPAEARTAADRIFSVSTTTGRLDAPAEMGRGSRSCSDPSTRSASSASCA
jgi:hypothetical protein